MSRTEKRMPCLKYQPDTLIYEEGYEIQRCFVLRSNRLLLITTVLTV